MWFQMLTLSASFYHGPVNEIMYDILVFFLSRTHVALDVTTSSSFAFQGEVAETSAKNRRFGLPA